jgi:hypothetical protein
MDRGIHGGVMSRHKRKSNLWMARRGYWWVPSLKKWVKQEDISKINADFYSNHRQFHTLKRLERAVRGAKFSYYAEAMYYKTSKHGKGWESHWTFKEL